LDKNRAWHAPRLHALSHALDVISHALPRRQETGIVFERHEGAITAISFQLSPSQFDSAFVPDHGGVQIAGDRGVAG
jgi:hypothetical protein